jgi:hypothetical protein
MALRSYIHSSFDPRRIPGLESWWDAADAASVTLDSGRVSQLADKSGNGRHLTNTTSGSTQPSYVTAGRNGLNVARFAAASVQRLTVVNNKSAFNFLHNGTACWWISVNTYGTDSNPLTDYHLFATSIGSNFVGYGFGYRDSATTNNAANFSTSRGVGGSPASECTNSARTSVLAAYQNILTPNTLLVQDCLLKANDATASERVALSVNGSAAIKANVFTGAPSTANAIYDLTVGIAFEEGVYYGPLQGDICELMLFSQQPTAAARDLIRRYLGAKWGVSVG